VLAWNPAMSESNSDAKSITVDEKRAEYEQFNMVVLNEEGSGYVNIRNSSYSNGNHTYSVEVSDGETVGCSCPHHQHRDAHCKHQVAVEQSPIVLSSVAATQVGRVATDGGQDESEESDREETECHHTTDDPNDCLICELQEKYDVDGSSDGETIIDTDGDERPTRTESPDMGGGPTSGVDEL